MLQISDFTTLEAVSLVDGLVEACSPMSTTLAFISSSLQSVAPNTQLDATMVTAECKKKERRTW